MKDNKPHLYEYVPVDENEYIMFVRSGHFHRLEIINNETDLVTLNEYDDGLVVLGHWRNRKTIKIISNVPLNRIRNDKDNMTEYSVEIQT